MLFDLKGKRRRMVQGTYLTLAILIGLGLVLFGVGSSTSGGLGNLFGSNGSGANNGNQIVQKQVNSAKKQLAANPNDTAALKQIVTGYYQLASPYADQNTGQFNNTGKGYLRQAASAWERYLGVVKNPDPTLANYMFNAYSQIGLNDPAKAQQAAELVAAASPSSANYVRVVEFAALAHDTRTVALASQKALALAPASQRATVRQQINSFKAGGSAQPTTATSGGSTP
jgi:hypothetical protein